VAPRPDGDDRTVHVTVPASSANLGPGFDALAVALDLAFAVRGEPRGRLRSPPPGEGAAELPTDDTNLLWRALVACCDRLGAPAPDVTLVVDNAIPLERGMGSSAAAAVAGVALGRALTGASLGAHELIDLAAGIEGHPDNAAAAVLGGLVLCRGGRYSRLEPTSALRPVLCIPDARHSTNAARAVLPATVTLGEAAANGARTAAVLAGLAGLLPLDARAMTDVLHEPARFRVMPGAARLVQALRADGVPACLSGAGPSVLAVVDAGSDAAVERVRAHAEADWTVRPACWDRTGALAWDGCRPL
jgi:homoserine kinase